MTKTDKQSEDTKTESTEQNTKSTTTPEETKTESTESTQESSTELTDEERAKGEAALAQAEADVKAELDAKSKLADEDKEMLESLSVTEIYKNTRGEYFTEYSFAVLSESGDKKKVKTIKA